MSVIWIDGLDRTGKDTQCKLLLSAISPCITIHGYNCSGVDDNTQREIQKLNVIEGFRLFDQNPTIQFLCNRTHLGETIYGSMYRHYDTNYVFDIEKQYKEQSWFKNSSLFIFVDDPKNLLEREDGKSSNDYNIENIKKEKELFELAFEQPCHVF